jgi:hypothetical protein
VGIAGVYGISFFDVTVGKLGRADEWISV